MILGPRRWKELKRHLNKQFKFDRLRRNDPVAFLAAVKDGETFYAYNPLPVALEDEFIKRLEADSTLKGEVKVVGRCRLVQFDAPSEALAVRGFWALVKTYRDMGLRDITQEGPKRLSKEDADYYFAEYRPHEMMPLASIIGGHHE